MNELQQMKMQMEQLMNMMKQKDQIIADQNMKLNSLSNINNQQQNMQQNMQLPMNQQINPYQNMMQQNIMQNAQPMNLQQSNAQQSMPNQNNMQVPDSNSFLGYPQNFNQYIPNGYGNIPNMH